MYLVQLQSARKTKTSDPASQEAGWARWILAAGLILLGLLAAPDRAGAQSRLAEFLAKVPPGELIPGADAYQAPGGTPPVAAVRAGDRTVGYAFVNADWVDSTGYSGKPIEILVGLSADGKIVGARLMDHHEPIFLVGIPIARVAKFINGYVGRNVLEIAHAGPSRRPDVDIVSGATVTSTVIAESMVRSAIRVARAEGMMGPAIIAVTAAAREIDPDRAAPATWSGLLGDGSVRRLTLTVGQITEAFRKGGNEAAAAAAELENAADPFIDLNLAPVSVPGIGRALLGDAGYADLRKTLKPGEQALLIAANGPYSFKGSGYVRGGIFDRIAVLQGDLSIRFRDSEHRRLGSLSVAGAPQFRDVDLFVVPAGSGFDIAAPWRLQLLGERAWGGRDKAFLTFTLDYTLPTAYLKPAPAAAPAAPLAASAANDEGPPLWQMMWRAKQGQIIVLLVAIVALTAIFFFQDWLVKRPVLYDRLRLSFQAFSLFWIGWYAQAQLSIVNVLAFFNALRTTFRWDYFLMAPLIFILWFASAASLLFWNRGAFCGWLCPFGALQELLNQAARLLKIPQIRVPFAVHQRLVALKYIIFLVLFGLSFGSLGAAEEAAEVEPFKTAIILHFARVAVRALCRRAAGRQSHGGALLLPLPLPARRRARDPGAAAHVRLAATLPRMRQSLPALRQRMPGAGDPSRGTHQSQ